MNVACIGMGWWSDVLADAIMRSGRMKIAACYSRSRDKREAFARKYACTAASSYEEILGDRRIEAIINTTPNSAHLETTHAAAAAGKHVFLDKPIANTVAEGFEIFGSAIVSSAIYVESTPSGTETLLGVEFNAGLRYEFTTMPGLGLTEPQVGRLCTADASTSASALRALVSAGFLRAMPDGTYRRTDLGTSAQADPLRAGHAPIVPSPWRRILCLVDLDHDGGHALSPAAHSALRYATTLAVTNRARITALQVISPPSSDSVRTSETDALGKSLSWEPFRGLIDVQVATGAPDDELARHGQRRDAAGQDRPEGRARSAVCDGLDHQAAAV